MGKTILRNEEKRDYYGYSVYKNGIIMSLKGEPLSPYTATYKNSHVNMTINGKKTKKNRAILIYNMFSEKPLDRKHIIRFKDGNSDNVAFDNLMPVTRKEYYHSIGLNGKSRMTEEEKDEIRRIYENRNNSVSIRDLCIKYGCSLLTIQKILKGKDYGRRK